tara:strand:+ start:480 stop:1496 length:1017 start_codon:yes stop_codon:yes gene_type:complete
MFKKFFRKVRETVKKVAPIAAPIAGMLSANPLIGAGIGALLGQYGGKKGALQGAMLGGLGNFFKPGSGNFSKFIGGFDKAAVPGSVTQGMAQGAVEGSGLLGTAQNILGGGGLGKILSNDLVQKYGIPALIGLFTKNQLENQDMSKADINAYRSLIDKKYDSVTGGSPFAEDNFRGMQYNPVNEQYYDYQTKDGEYKNFKIDDDGKIIEDVSISKGFNKGGIAALNFGGAPHRMSFQVNQQPVLNRAVGGEIFDPQMTGGEMMDEIKENPGITQYFPPKFGEITGPGGPKDDKIPAMLSDGEFVMTAKAVDNAGGPKAMYNLMNKLDPESSKGKGILS